MSFQWRYIYTLNNYQKVRFGNVNTSSIVWSDNGASYRLIIEDVLRTNERENINRRWSKSRKSLHKITFESSDGLQKGFRSLFVPLRNRRALQKCTLNTWDYLWNDIFVVENSIKHITVVWRVGLLYLF